MINILFVSHSSGMAGAERCLLTLLQQLDRTKFNPLVVLPSEGILLNEIASLGIDFEIIYFPWWFRARDSVDLSVFAPTMEDAWERLGNTALVPLSEKALTERLNRLLLLITERNIHIIHTNTITMLEPGLAARIAGIKHVWHVHELIDGHPSLTSLLPESAIDWALNNLADRIVVPSLNVMQTYARRVAAGRLTHIYSGVSSVSSCNELSLKREEAREHYRREFRIESLGHLICSVGQCSPEKDWLGLIKTALLLSRARTDFQMVVVGHIGPDSKYGSAVLDRLRELDLADRVTFTGFRKDARDIMLACDVLFHPSSMEVLPLSVIEAMSAGLPVVATRCGGLEEIVSHNETGLLTEVADYSGMADALDVLLGNASKRQELGEKGREVYLRRFSPNQYANNFVQMYRDVVESASSARQCENGSNLQGLRAFGALYASIFSFSMYLRSIEDHFNLILGKISSANFGVRHQGEDLISRVKDFKLQFDRLGATIDLILKSSSWKITAPLRWIAEKVRRVTRSFSRVASKHD